MPLSAFKPDTRSAEPLWNRPTGDKLSSVLYTGRPPTPQPSTLDSSNFPHSGCGIEKTWSNTFYWRLFVLIPQVYPQFSPGFPGVSPTLSTRLSTGSFGRVGVKSLVCDSAPQPSANSSPGRVARGFGPTVSRALRRVRSPSRRRCRRVAVETDPALSSAVPEARRRPSCR
jgi:hypothetical protein